MRIWMIYDDKYGHCKKLAKTIEELLEGDFDVRVGIGKKISPADVIADEPDAVIVGGPLSRAKPSRIISSWVKHFSQILDKTGIQIQKAFAFCTWKSTPNCDLAWQNLFQKYPIAEHVFPQVLGVRVGVKNQHIIFEKNPHMYEIIESLRQFLLCDIRG